MDQEIQFTSTADGVSIAYASAGSGPPIVKAGNWMNHLEYDWRSPVWRHLLEEFARDQQLIRYDVRGTGLSDRSAKELSLDAFVSDLSSVIAATGLERFPLLGISQGGPVAIAYAIRHPEKVSHLILFGSFAAGWKAADLTDELRQKREAQVTLIRQEWHSKNPAIRQLWTTLCIPDAQPEEATSFNELQRQAATPELAGRMFEAIGELDVTSMLPELKVPVLVLHSKGDSIVPFEEGRRLASLIPGAKFVSLESRNHLLLRHEPAWPIFVGEVRRFLGRETTPSPAAVTEQMKHCGTCGRVYGDPTLRYCLDDGTLLSPQPDSDSETVILPKTA
jgi:pimeloyl-ACP methyl ester carboxylesterase